MASSEDEQAATILRGINNPQSKKRANDEGQITSRKKKTIDKNREQHQKNISNDGDEAKDSATEYEVLGKIGKHQQVVNKASQYANKKLNILLYYLNT